MDLLEKMNLALIETEQAAYRTRTPIEHPYFFVIGAPRSGTTVLTQVLVHAMNAGYITNIAARFYLAPTVGIQLSREATDGDSGSPGFWSYHGQTIMPWDIHEFGKFWMNHLDFPSSSKVDLKRLAWLEARMLKNRLQTIWQEFQRPIVMKGIYPAYCYRTINDMLKDKVVWVNIERDHIDTCLSILKVRKRKKGKWFGWYIPVSERAHFMHVDLHWQIAYQVHYFRQFYRKIATHTIQLEDLCADPLKCVEDVCENRQVVDDMSNVPLRFNTYADRCPEDAAHFRKIWEAIDA